MTKGTILLTTIYTFMTAQHKSCDEMFARAEELVANDDWKHGISQWNEFSAELEKHFLREENILFPEFEEVSGMAGGPTQMMCVEHEQMRALVNEINKAAVSKDKDHFLGLTETLMITMQQHNMKEEQILYPMTDQSLPDAHDIIDRMSQD